ncbi:hypothetical protein RHMOL_Rhmol07G0125500 [Rhododendron molle]|uniref:Uncharacterized protein n=1 Tax=Rhododendron molle TaxID=49168 RepID=A0ACC0N0X5_RHOML|nr:hypothetical protein RHMOL_Rhmol07G0125500 [Rhododendron molle]
MATQWVKSCKSTSANDVVNEHRHKPPKHRPVAVSSSCRKGVQSLKDVIETTKPKKPRKKAKQPSSVAPEPGSDREKTRVQTVTVGPFAPAFTELPAGHPSRNVVEMIFRSGWSPEPFSGRVEIVFKVRNSSGTAARFEEYREKVKARVSCGGGGDHARCAADGNEVMGFHSLGPADGGLGYDGAWASHCRKGAVCVFSGGGEAHESSGGGGGRGRRAMLVCRVIAGRVGKRMGLKPLSEGRVGFDSVSGENGELVVCDTRAVLPCFLILYKL